MITNTSQHIALLFFTLIIGISVSQSSIANGVDINTQQQSIQSPYLALEATGMKLFNRISNNQQELEKFPDIMRDIIEQELMPMIDYKYAAYKILGTNLRKTTSEQRKSFVTSMRQYLVKTYAKALNSYNDQKVIFEADKNIRNKKIIGINAKIIDANKPEVNLTFMMRKNKKTQQWKVYDMVVEGISLLNTKKSEINQRIAKHGLEQVTLELASLAK